MKKFPFFLALLFAFGLSGFARCEEAPLTWDACAKEALAHNPDLQEAAANLRSAKYSKTGTVSAFLPSLSASASANRSGDEGSLSAIMKDHDADVSYEMGLNASINLFNGFKDKASYDAASLTQQQYEVKYRQARSQLSYNLRNAFTNLLYAQQQVALMEEIAARQVENVRMVELRYESGHENKGSLLNNQAASAQADLEVTQAKRSLRVAQRTLDRALGRSELDAPLVSGTFKVATVENEPDFQLLSRTTFSYLLADLQTRTAQTNVVSARGSFFPTLNANGSMSRSGSDWVPNQHSWGAGLVLSYPLFEGGQRIEALKAAEANRDSSKIALKAAEQDAALSLESTYWDLRNASESTVVQEKYLEAVKTQEEVASAQYANGLLSYQDWDTVENNLTTRQKSNLQSLRDAKTAEAAWQLALGKDELN
jgi:outer membrane protein TolC